MEDNIELTAKLKLDISDAEKQLDSLSAKTPQVKDKKKKLPKEASDSLKDLFQGDKGLKNIGKLAKSATGGIQSFNNSLSGMSAGLGEAGLAIVAVTAAIAVIIKLLQGTDTMAEIGNKLTEVFDTLREVMAPVLSQLGDIVMVVLDVVKDILPLLKTAFDSVAFSLRTLSFVLKLIEPIIKLVGDAFNFLYDIFKNILKTLSFGLFDLDNLMGSTTATKTKGYKSSLDVWETSGEIAKEQLDEEKKSTSLLDSLNNTWDSLKTSFNWLTENILKPIKDTVLSIFSFIKNTGKNVISGVTADKSLGFGGGLFTKQGRWGNGYQFGDIIGSAVDFIAGIFGKGWLWADGGTLDLGAQVWGMNEKGNPEFMFNAGGHDTVINSEILEDAMYSAVARANANRSNRIEVGIKEGVASGPRELVQWILPSLKFSLK